jgi:hypothetical protein
LRSEPFGAYRQPIRCTEPGRARLADGA